MISQTDIAVALERAWREAMPGNEGATPNAMLRALYELLKPRPAVGRFIVVGGEAAGASHRNPASVMSTSTRSIAGTLKTIWIIGNGNRGTRSGPDNDRALSAGSTPPQTAACRVGTKKSISY